MTNCAEKDLIEAFAWLDISASFGNTGANQEKESLASKKTRLQRRGTLIRNPPSK